ncbi:MAG: TlpA disulfide reductase family protein [Dehalococcoidia bacterium]
MAKSKSRSGSRPAQPAKPTQAGAVQTPPSVNTQASPPPKPAKSTGRKRTTYNRRTRSGLSWGWIAVGVAAVAIVALIAYNVFSNQSGGGSTTVGKITGPSLSPQQRASGSLPVGTPAPNLTWTLDGQEGSLEALKGQPVLLEFFATWCPHCQAETAVLRQVQSKYGDKIRIVAVSASPNGLDQRSPSSVADIERFQSRFNAPYQHFYDMDLVGGRLYGVNSFPTLYLLDKNGVIQFTQEGEVPESTLSAQIDKLLAN